jgi:dual specificity MAP kinase phosphatase
MVFRPFSSMLIIDDLEAFEIAHPELVAIDSCGRTTDNKLEFLSQEREEMRRLTTATKISQNVYLGNSADAFNSVIEYITADGKSAAKGFDVCIEAKDMAEVATAATLKEAETFLNGEGNTDILLNRSGSWYARSLTRPLALEFPSSTPPLMTRHNPEAIVNFCDWIYHITHTPPPTQSSEEDAVMTDSEQIDEEESPANERTVLIHCQDGYTESTFLALAYLIFAEGITAHEAWVKLHTTLQRSFFAFESDLQALKYLQSHLLARSPSQTSFRRISTPISTPSWFTHGSFDGSFPSRILPHMYLGNLQHANNPEMLRALGITRVLSIGEQVVWDVEAEMAAGMHLMYLDNVQDNGIDPLLECIDPCLDFLGTPPPYQPCLPPLL